jgi:hypothetical protein
VPGQTLHTVCLPEPGPTMVFGWRVDCLNRHSSLSRAYTPEIAIGASITLRLCYSLMQSRDDIELMGLVMEAYRTQL